MRNVKFSLRKKILAGFSVLVVLFLLSVAINSAVLSRNNSLLRYSSEVVNPSLDAINEFTLLVTRSKMLVTNWVYMQSNSEDKDALRKLQDTEYPKLADRLGQLSSKWDSEYEQAVLDTAMLHFDTLLSVNRDIMQSLVSFESYEDPMVKLVAEDNIETQVLPRTRIVLDKLAALEETKRKDVSETEQELIGSSEAMLTSYIVLGLVLTVLSLVTAFLIMRTVTRPVYYVKNIVTKLGNGELPTRERRKVSNDETGEMILAVDQLVDGLRSTSDFANKIGQGHYDAEFEPLSDDDVLGNALIEMRNNLKEVGEEDRRRNWASEGLAKFGELLRSQTSDLGTLGDQVLSQLVGYVGANQGSLFLVRHEEGEEPYLYLQSSFAWEKKKYLEQKITKGEGLTGQAWLEAEQIYLTEVPDSYIRITSGLGDANPSALFIVPIMLNEEVHGVLELASFEEFPDYVREFVSKVAESIASTVSSVRVSERTRELLEESQELTEQMRAQEEEMRQNMEELQATQEEMQRRTSDLEQLTRSVPGIILQMTVNKDTEAVTLQFVSDQATDLVGKSPGEVVAAGQVDGLLHNEDRPAWLAALVSVAKTGQARHFEVRLRGADGKFMNSLATLQLVESKSSEATAFVSAYIQPMQMA